MNSDSERRDDASRASPDAADLSPEQLLAMREEALRKLEESEERFRTALETAPIPMLISRVADGVIVYVNERLSEAYGEPTTNFLGKSTLDFYADPDERQRLLDQLARDGRLQDCELRARREDGQLRWVSVSAQPIAYQGEACLLAALLDITARKDAEQVLLDERRRLRHLLNLQEHERRLVAYEIHDGLVQDMVGALMSLESISPAVLADPVAARETIDSCTDMMREAVNEARRLINGLRPPVLEESGLAAGLQSLIDEITSRSGLVIEYEHDVRFERLSPCLETAVYRIVQESLNNVWKHSRSPIARVEMEQHGETLKLSVRDWGKGFDPNQVPRGHLGLEGIRERVRLLDGQVEILSKPGEGTSIRVELPLSDEVNVSDEANGPS